MEVVHESACFEGMTSGGVWCGKRRLESRLSVTVSTAVEGRGNGLTCTALSGTDCRAKRDWEIGRVCRQLSEWIRADKSDLLCLLKPQKWVHPTEKKRLCLRLCECLDGNYLLELSNDPRSRVDDQQRTVTPPRVPRRERGFHRVVQWPGSDRITPFRRHELSQQLLQLRTRFGIVDARDEVPTAHQWLQRP